MSKGTCTKCNKEFKNVEVHSRYCKDKAMKQEPITSIKPQISLETKENKGIDRNISNIKNMLYFNIFLNFMTILTLVVVIILAE